MTINSRAKGAAAEREFANYLKTQGLNARRGQQFSGGAGSPDVVCEVLPHVHWEVKRVEKGNPYVWLHQAEKDAGGKIPVVAHRKNNEPWMAILPMRFLIDLLRDAGHVKPD